jgi:hypothetical protein
LLGIVVGSHAFEGGANADADDDGPVVGQEDVSRVEHEVVHARLRCFGECVGDRSGHEPGLFGTERRDRQPLAERGADQPAGHDKDPSFVLSCIDDAQQSRVFDRGGLLSGPTHGLAVWMPGVEK